MTNPQVTNRNSQTFGPYSHLLPWPMLLNVELAPHSEMLVGSATIRVADVEFGWNHVGLEERVADGGIDWTRALSVVEHLCVSCSQANLLCFVQAAEAMSHLIVPARAAHLRLLLAETERIVSHLQSASDIINAIGLPVQATAMREVRERMINAVADWTGVRQQPGLITYGGMTHNMDEAATRSLSLAARHCERALRAQVVATINSRGIAGRLSEMAVIKGSEALAAGLRGPILRASGVASDVRVSFPTGAYEDEAVTIIVQRTGDAFARLVVRLLECLESFRIIEQALDDLPAGPVRARGTHEMRTGKGISRVEGPRGEILCWVDGAPEGLRGIHLSAGSFPTLGILPGILRGVRIEDMPLVLLSLDLCLPCAER
jgi:Ni,Fe-hydrogenase III large subunit